MRSLQKKLIGALIGLARATDGNEHLITHDATVVVMDCLASIQAEDTQLEYLLSMVENAKRKMVPNCFLCASPCGRTSDYDLDELQNAPPEIRKIKNRILETLQFLAGSGVCGYNPQILYKALIVIGLEDYDAEALTVVLKELEFHITM